MLAGRKGREWKETPQAEDDLHDVCLFFSTFDTLKWK